MSVIAGVPSFVKTPPVASVPLLLLLVLDVPGTSAVKSELAVVSMLVHEFLPLLGTTFLL
jgi:hypothetical protein